MLRPRPGAGAFFPPGPDAGGRFHRPHILLEAPDTIALSPDGHGGALRALDRSGALDQMHARGVDTLAYFQVDNPLVRCMDPEFMAGISWRRGMSAKMVPKTGRTRNSATSAPQSGRPVVIEYSDLPAATPARG